MMNSAIYCSMKIAMAQTNNTYMTNHEGKQGMTISSIKYHLIAAVCTIVAALAMIVTPAHAYPGSCCLIPTTDMLVPGTMRLAYESDGRNNPYDKNNTQYLYAQYGVSKKLEVGVDLYDVTRVSGGNTTYFNGKYLLMAETKKKPALAVGGMFIGTSADPTYYAIACKSFDKARLHIGAQTSDGSTSTLLGSDYALGNGWSAMADYQSGPGRWHTLGLFWQESPEVGILLYYVRNNTADLRADNDYVGFNIAYTFPLK